MSSRPVRLTAKTLCRVDAKLDVAQNSDMTAVDFAGTFEQMVAFVFVFEYIEYGNVLGVDNVSDNPYHDDGSPERPAQRLCFRERR